MMIPQPDHRQRIHNDVTTTRMGHTYVFFFLPSDCARLEQLHATCAEPRTRYGLGDAVVRHDGEHCSTVRLPEPSDRVAQPSEGEALYGRGETRERASDRSRVLSFICIILLLSKHPHPDLAPFDSRSPQHLGNALREGFRHIDERKSLFDLNRTDEVRIDVRFVGDGPDQITGPDAGVAPRSHVEARHAGFTATRCSVLRGRHGLSAMSVPGCAIPMEALTLR